MLQYKYNIRFYMTKIKKIVLLNIFFQKLKLIFKIQFSK